MKKPQFFYWASVIALGVVVGLALQFAKAWTEPGSTPPGGNIGAPINTGGDAQFKEGGLVIHTSAADAAHPNGLIVQNGYVGIGVLSPSAKLEVNGKIKSNPTVSTDSGDTATTKSYVDALQTYGKCGYENGNMCNSGELMRGYTGTQVYCCGKNDITCVASDWSTVSTYCVGSSSLPCKACETRDYGKTVDVQSRVLSDCLSETREVTTSKICGRTCSPNTHCSTPEY